MKEIKINVEGMMCEGCEKRVVNSLSMIKGVQEVVANYKAGTVTIKINEEIETNIIKDRIEELGFEVKED